VSNAVDAAKRAQFSALFQEFAQAYPHTPVGREHAARYATVRNAARENYQYLRAAAARGEDITDVVLRTLLPHTDSAAHHWQGAWIHWAPTVLGDIRSWYEAAGWTQPDDWPVIARAIYHFVQRCVDAPAQLTEACRAFAALPHTTGFQSGTLSPILNALCPDAFLLVNNKSRSALNYFTGAAHSGRLLDYPAANAALHALIAELSAPVEAHKPPLLSHADAFDMFCHWLTAHKKFPFRTPRYWAIAIGDEPGQWHEWQQGHFVGLGWDELGDISGLTRRAFNQRRDSLVAQHADWSKRGVEQVWRFMRQVREGDRVVVHRPHETDQTVALGMGTVVGPYYFAPHVPAGHRVPVEWNDTTSRRVDNVSWRRALHEIELAQFEAARQAPAAGIATAPAGMPVADVPAFVPYLAPIVDVLHTLGGAGSAGQVIDRALAHSAVTDTDIAENQEERAARVRRARDLLVRAGLVESRPRGVWRLTDAGAVLDPSSLDSRELFRELVYQRNVAQTLQNASPAIRTLAESSASYDATAGAESSGATEAAPATPTVAQDTDVVMQPPYLLADCAAVTGFDEDTLRRWVRAIERKGQAIFYGPPGTGKTFMAEQLARHLVGGDDGFVEIVQFHPAYAYEDFVQGIRPQTGPHSELTYPVTPGRFLQVCARAATRTGRCVLIIDEINRANLTRVFGEVLYLLEYRDKAITLAGGAEPFRIPPNLRILGTMNTADRSIALVDHALRRRFAFIALHPNYDVLRHFHRRHATGFPVDKLIALLERLNRQIGDPQVAVGISFFLHEELADELEDIWRMEIEPYLEELFFDQPARVAEWRWARVEREVLG